MYANSTSAYFGLDPPTVQEYFKFGFTRSAINVPKLNIYF